MGHGRKRENGRKERERERKKEGVQMRENENSFLRESEKPSEVHKWEPIEILL